MNRNHTRRISALAAAAFAILLAPTARAGGVHDIPLTSIPLARNPITIDGSFADWPDTHPAVFAPLDPGLAKPAPGVEAVALDQLRRRPAAAALQACYDSKALYLGVAWRGVTRQGGALTLHVQTDRIAHVRVSPAATERQGLLQERLGDAATWRTLAAGAEVAAASQPDGTTVEEVRLPWQALAASGKASASLTLAADLTWPQVTAAFLRQLPAGVRHDNTHLTVCFLTSPAKLFGRDVSLGDPNDWGTLRFAEGPHANATQTSALAVGATETYVSRVPTPLTVDGSLSGWKSNQFQKAAYAPGLLGDRYSAKIATSYDNDFLYIAARVKALGGPLNTQPEATQAGYLGGDCLQVRLNDGQHTVNLCGWYDTAGKKAALTADGNDLKNPFLMQQGAKEAFREDTDGQGYTQVMAVPWKVLSNGGAPKAGDAWKATFQFWWAGLNPQFTALAQASLGQGGGIAYSYQLPNETDVTLAVFDAQGRLVRTLVKDAHRRAGRNTVYWDGRDQFGSWVSPGKYQVRGIEHPPITTTPLVSIVNPGSPPWPTADGRGDWLSDEMAPQGAVTDGTNVYLAAPGSEKGNSIIAVDAQGRRLWGHQESIYGRSVSLALAGPYLYALYSGPESVNASGGGPNVVGRAVLVCLDKSTGAPALFSTQKTDFEAARWPYVNHLAGLYDLRANKAFTPATYEGQPRYYANDLGETTEAVGIAAAGGRLYVSMLTQNQLLVLDGKTGAQVDTIPVPQPVGLRARADGRLWGISAGKVVSVDPATKIVTTLIAHDLVAPHDVTTDHNGDLYVSDWGSSFQVKEFAPDGRLLRTFGKAGGRPWVGRWDPDGMLLPRGMAVTDDGKLWVAEDDASPYRVSVWDVTTGALVHDYIGPAPYGGGGFVWADPNDPSTVVAEGTFFHVDYAKKTWTPMATAYRHMSLDQAFTPNAQNGMPGSRTIVHDGKQYIFFSASDYRVVVFRRDGQTLTPVAAVGSLGRLTARDGSSARIWDSDQGAPDVPNYYPDFFKPHLGDNFVWTDKNSDGAVQSNEMQWVHVLGRGETYAPGATAEINCAWGFGIGPDGTLFVAGETKNSSSLIRVDIKGWSASGAPEYDMAAAKTIVEGQTPGGMHGLFVDDLNHVYATHGYEWNPSKHHALDAYDRDGKLLWSFSAPEGRQQDDDYQADNVIAEFREPGVGEVLASWLWHANFKPYLFTPDGLYVGSLLDDTKLGPTATWDESYKNYFQAPDGTAYIVNGANDAFHIDKITGLNQIHRFGGAITVSQADLSAAAEASARVAAAPPAVPQPSVHVAWMASPPTIDGDLGDWDMAAGAALSGSKGRSARVALARDIKNLYLAYDVHGAKLVNRGGNWQTLFISGDCDDLMLHVGAFSPHFSPAKGDERLLLSVYQGQPVAVLYRPVVPGTTAPTRLMATDIDQIVRLPAARIAYKRAGNGYTLEASVPLSDLGMVAAPAAPADPSVGTTLKGDVGVIYADETGADRSLRLYYYNHDTGMTADLTTEARLQPGNWGDVEMPLGPNLLKNGDFEQPLAATSDAGWAVTNARNGGTATVAAGVGYSGGHALLLQQTTPIAYAADAYTLPDYGAFIHSANGGKDGGYVEIRQRVPVTGGHKYTLRFHLRTLDFRGGEKKDPGPGHGYDALGTSVRWEGAGGGVWATNHQDTTPDWTSLTDPRFNYYGPAMPYTAPPGATAAIIQFGLTANAAQRLPKAYLDDVEFVEVR